MSNHPFILESEDGLEPADLQRLPLLNHQVEVKAYKDVKTREIRNYRINHIVSPYQFYTEFELCQPLGGKKSWFEEMQDFYNDPNASARFKVRTSTLLKFRCYVHRDEETKLWQRVRVFKVEKYKRTAEVYFCDMSQFRSISFDSVMELTKDFASWSAQGFRTHLIHIRPVGGGLTWDEKAIDYFKKIALKQVFRTIVISRSEEPMPEGFPEKILYNGVVMLRKVPEGEITLQAEMVKAGFAEATGACGGYRAMFDMSFGPGSFSLVDFEDADETEMISDLEGNPEPVENRPSLELVKEIMTRVRDKTRIMRAQAMELERILASRKETNKVYFREPIPEQTEEHLPPLFQHKVGFIKFAHMVSPSCCFVQMALSVPQLREMEAALTLVVDCQPQIPFSEARAGIAVACFLQENPSREPCYVRAFVRQTVPNVHLVKVVLIDYGNEISVKYNFTRYLPEFFKKIPSFAYRVHLVSDHIFPSGGKHWSSDAADTFRKYIIAWESENPIYYAWRAKEGERIYLQDFNQDMCYNSEAKCWVASQVKPTPLNQPMNALKDHHLIASLYVSTAVDICYEILLTRGNCFRFEHLIDMLEDSGYALKVGKSQTCDEAHAEIVKATASKL